jgi:hypothetical protein
MCTNFVSSLVAGFFMTCTVAPWDNLRTRLQNQPTTETVYQGFGDCLIKTVRNDGVLSLWRGFIPIWARFATMSVIQLMTTPLDSGAFKQSSVVVLVV